MFFARYLSANSFALKGITFHGFTMLYGKSQYPSKLKYRRQKYRKTKNLNFPRKKKIKICKKMQERL